MWRKNLIFFIAISLLLFFVYLFYTGEKNNLGLATGLIASGIFLLILYNFDNVKKLGFDIQRFFDMSHFKPEVQEKFKGWDLDKLISIFNERHAIVHDGKRPLTSLNDLFNRHDFFSKLMTNISIEIYNKFNIKNNLDLPEVLQQD